MYIALQLLGVRDDSWLSETSRTATARGAGCWTVDFDLHVQHYSDSRHKKRDCGLYISSVDVDLLYFDVNAEMILFVIPNISFRLQLLKLNYL